MNLHGILRVVTVLALVQLSLARFPTFAGFLGFSGFGSSPDVPADPETPKNDAPISSGDNNPNSNTLSQADKDEYLKLQNQARADVGVKPLAWDTKLEDYALSYANKRAGSCEMVHSHGPYGENLAWGIPDLSPKGAVMDIWVSEKSDYVYSSNSCNAGEGKCLHYTQIVWRDTARVGCTKVPCQKLSQSGVFIICSYDPIGNYPGQRPY